MSTERLEPPDMKITEGAMQLLDKTISTGCNNFKKSIQPFNLFNYARSVRAKLPSSIAMQVDEIASNCFNDKTDLVMIGQEVAANALRNGLILGSNMYAYFNKHTLFADPVAYLDLLHQQMSEFEDMVIDTEDPLWVLSDFSDRFFGRATLNGLGGERAFSSRRPEGAPRVAMLNIFTGAVVVSASVSVGMLITERANLFPDELTLHAISNSADEIANTPSGRFNALPEVIGLFTPESDKPL